MSNEKQETTESFGEVVRPLSDASEPWDRVATAAGQAAEREGYFGFVMVGFKMKADGKTWGLDSTLGTIDGIDDFSVRPEMLVAAIGLLEKLRNQAVRFYVKAQDANAADAAKGTK
jgi:hypothetical protein